MATGMHIIRGLNTGFPEPGEVIPGAVSPLVERMGIGLFAVLGAGVLTGIWMVLVHGVPLPLEAICLRG